MLCGVAAMPIVGGSAIGAGGTGYTAACVTAVAVGKAAKGFASSGWEAGATRGVVVRVNMGTAEAVTAAAGVGEASTATEVEGGSSRRVWTASGDSILRCLKWRSAGALSSALPP